MEATLNFTLPEDQQDLDDALNGSKWRNAIMEIDEQLRQKIKHGEMTDAELSVMAEIRKLLRDECQARGVQL
jgi:hypothetical protein